jgi:hypothetical protein
MKMINGKNNPFGIHFPLGIKDIGIPMMTRRRLTGMVNHYNGYVKG